MNEQLKHLEKEICHLHAVNELLSSAADKLRIAWRDEVHSLMKDKDRLHAENERLSATVKAREGEILTHSEAFYEATRLLSEEREKNERLATEVANRNRRVLAGDEAVSALARADPTDPGHDVDVLREQVKHLERRVRQLTEELNKLKQNSKGWIGCGECDCSFQCHNGNAICIRI